MITAKEARELSGPTVEDHLAEAHAAIRKAAENKKREVALHSSFWVNEGYKGTKDWHKAKNNLTDLGFTVEFFYEERQFVNAYTKVSW